MIGYPYLSILGAVLLFALVVSTWFTMFKIVLQFGVPWLLFLSAAYYFWKRQNAVVAQPQEETGAAKEDAK